MNNFLNSVQNLYLNDIKKNIIIMYASRNDKTRFFISGL